MRNLLSGFLGKTLLSLALILIGLGTSQAFSEEWSPAQREIWKMVETYWSTYKEKGGESLPAFYYIEAIVWGAETPWPSERNIVSYGGGDGLGGLIDSYALTPHKITVFDDVAIAYYESKGTYLGKPFRLRFSQTWLKKDGKWKIAGAMHGSCTKLPRCP
jgi:hypothetical protein